MTTAAMKHESNSKYEEICLVDRVSFWFGLLYLVMYLPLAGLIVGLAVLWDFLDRGFMGKPLEGVIFRIAAFINTRTQTFNEKFVKNPLDAFMVNSVILMGIFVPALYLVNALYTQAYGFSFAMWTMYQIIRIGPYFMNFAYCYTLCHKEGHAHTGLWKRPYSAVMGNVFNWWIGLFYGVMPSSFAYGHSINHHKYNNGPKDVVSTSDRPRDSVRAYVAFIPRFFLYAINYSTVLQFIEDGNIKIAVKMVYGSLVWLCFALLNAYLFSPMFAVAYVLYPVGEAALLLSCVAWCWHAFLNPDDPEDEYVGSVTIFNGHINVLNEDFHVVHHQYPGAHWENNPKLYEKHSLLNMYKDRMATIFNDTHVFELFFMIILRDYDALAARFVDLTDKLTMDEKKDLIKIRLRTCWWGPRCDLNLSLQGKEIGNFDVGRPNVEEKKSQ